MAKNRLPNDKFLHYSLSRRFSGLRVLIAALIALPSTSWANPTGGVVVGGSASITNSGTTLTVSQTTARAIINWNDFSIASGQTTRFVQPSATSAALNRVTGANPSSLLGTLSANGQIYLINPNGITVGPTGVINTQSFVASTLGLSNTAFLAGGNLTFSGTSAAGVSNAGRITALGGNILMIGRRVTNTGTLTAQNGTTGLAAGSQVLFTTTGNQRVFVQAGSASGGTGVDQRGQITAASAELAAAGGNVYALAINSAGPLTVGRVRMTGDRIALAGNTTTSGDQTYTGAVTAQNSVTLTSNSGALTFNGPVSEGFDLTTNSALNTTFNGPVTVYGRLHSNTTTPSGAVVINGGTVFSGGDQIYNGAVRLGANTTLTSPYGGVIFNSAAVNGPYALVVNSGLNTTFQRAVGATAPLSSLVVNITSQYGRARINGGTLTTRGDQTYNGPVDFDNNATVTSTGGNLVFNAAVNAGFSLVTNSALDTIFRGAVFLGNSLTANITSSGGYILPAGGSIVSGGDQTYNGILELSRDSISARNTLINSLYGNLIFDYITDTNGYTGNLTTNSAWNTTFNGGNPTNLMATARRFFLNGGIWGNGSGQFNGPVTLNSDATFGSDAGGTAFNGTVDGAYNLRAWGRGTHFNGAVGSVTPLASLDTNNGDNDIYVNGGSIRTVGDLNLGYGFGPVTLGADTTLTSSAGNVNLLGTVDGAHSLTTNSSLDTSFYKPVGSVTPLTSLTANITGTGSINKHGNTITTTGPQTYNGPVNP